MNELTGPQNEAVPYAMPSHQPPPGLPPVMPQAPTEQATANAIAIVPDGDGLPAGAEVAVVMLHG